MVNVDKAVIARLVKNGENFEILVDCDLAMDLKHGKEISIQSILADDKVFSDSKKGLITSEVSLQKVFLTDDINKVAKKIIIDGEIQLTSEYRQKLREQKRNRILQYINRNGIDPRTKLPHPLERLKLAFEEGNIKIDDFKSDQEQIKEIVQKLRLILPISFESISMEIKIPAQYSGKVYSIVQKYSTIKEDNWLSDGSWSGRIEVQAGNRDDLIDGINKSSHGEVEVKILK